MVGQHLPGRRGRRRLAPLLLLVQAARVDAHARASSPNCRSTSRRPSTSSGSAPHLRLGVAVESARWDDDRHSVGRPASTTARVDECHVLVSGVGFLNVPRYPDWPGRRPTSRARLPHRSLGARTRPDRQGRRGRRHRVVGDADRARDPADRAAPLPVPAGTGLGAAEGRTRLRRRRARRFSNRLAPASANAGGLKYLLEKNLWGGDIWRPGHEGQHGPRSRCAGATSTGSSRTVPTCATR